MVLMRIKSICADHELTLTGSQRCPHCARGTWPLRDLRALRDFANQPKPGTLDIAAHVATIRLSEVVRRLGRELVEIEADRLARCADLDLRSRDLRRRIKRMRLDTAALNCAVRAAIGFNDERKRLTDVGKAYLSVIEDDGINW
jgi:hypothetical protein